MATKGDKKKNIETMLKMRKTYYKKQQLKNYMLDIAEDLLIKRRNNLRYKRIEELKSRSCPKIPIRSREMFVEGRIEGDIRFFDGRLN